VIELGGLDGTAETHSQSLIFEQFGWRRVLIDGNPLYREGLSKQLQSFAVNAAICKDRSIVHYVINPKAQMTSGVAEFMPPSHMKQYFRHLYHHKQMHNNTFDGITWATKNVYPVHCLPIGDILMKAKITRVNFFILDVEGAEISILESFDFDKYQVDVFVIELNMGLKTILEFFADKPYKEVVQRGRNIWLQHVDFIPSRSKTVEPLCYRGAVKSGVWPRKHRLLCKNKKTAN
jgi:hypothetical protein